MKSIGYKNIDLFHTVGGNNLKRDLLYFDQIFISEKKFNHCSSFVDLSQGLERYEIMLSNINELEYLNKNELLIIEKPKVYFGDYPEFKDVNFLNINELSNTIEKIEKLNTNKVQQLLYRSIIDNLISNINSRQVCAALGKNQHLDIKPIMEIRLDDNYDLLFPNLKSEKLDYRKGHILRLMLKKIPIPGDLVSWERIFDFKANTEVKLHRLALINWVNEMSYSQMSLIEIEQKLDWLLAEYENALKKYQIKYSVGSLELVITTSLEFLEKFVKLEWSKAAKALFELKKRNVDLLINEASAPGKEVAYISKIKSSFK